MNFAQDTDSTKLEDMRYGEGHDAINSRDAASVAEDESGGFVVQ